MSNHTLIIAEAGVNHNGSIELAKQLVVAAADAGADVVKFQTFKASQLATAAATKATYQIANTEAGSSQLDMLRALELSANDYQTLNDLARDHNIGFMSTAFDSESLALLATFNMPAIKVPSGDITSVNLLLQAARQRSKMIVSTGMATLGDIEQALGVIAFGLMSDAVPDAKSAFEAAFFSREGRQALSEKVTLLHCVTDYPAAPEVINLRAMSTMASAFGLPVGYSDHTNGIEVSLAAVALGATVIEKHFTLDRSLPGPDHAASLEPTELKEMVRSIRNIEKALGNNDKQPAPEEVLNRVVARRSLVAAKEIRKGSSYTLDMFGEKRPGSGLPPIEMWSLLGKVANRDYQVDDLIER